MQQGALYVRVSTEDQIEFSPDAQLRALTEYAKKNKIIIKDDCIFIDKGISARTTNRPAFQQMIKTAKIKPKLFDVILVHKFDRFARNREDSVVFKSLLRKDCGIKVISITEQLEDDKFSVILEAMLEAMAEYYSLNLSDEVKKGMSEKAHTGGFLARPPLGYKVIKETKPPVIVPEEAEIIRLIFDKFANENWTYYKIANFLNLTFGSSSFHTPKIKYILSNPMYYGLIRWNMRDSTNKQKFKDENDWIVKKGLHEAIISEEIFSRVQVRMKQIKDGSLKYAAPIERTSHMLSGLMRCSSCDGSMSHNTRKQGSYFQCSNYCHGNCQVSHSISVKKLEKAILERIKHDAVSDEIINVEIVNSSNESIELELLEKMLLKIPDKYSRIKDAFANGVDTLHEYKDNKNKLTNEEIELKKRIEEIKNLDNTGIVNDKLKETLMSAYKSLTSDYLSLEDKKKTIRSFIKRIVFDNTNMELIITYYINE